MIVVVWRVERMDGKNLPPPAHPVARGLGCWDDRARPLPSRSRNRVRHQRIVQDGDGWRPACPEPGRLCHHSSEPQAHDGLPEIGFPELHPLRLDAKDGAFTKTDLVVCAPATFSKRHRAHTPVHSKIRPSGPVFPGRSRSRASGNDLLPMGIRNSAWCRCCPRGISGTAGASVP